MLIELQMDIKEEKIETKWSVNKRYEGNRIYRIFIDYFYCFILRENLIKVKN